MVSNEKVLESSCYFGWLIQNMWQKSVRAFFGKVSAIFIWKIDRIAIYGTEYFSFRKPEVSRSETFLYT